MQHVDSRLPVAAQPRHKPQSTNAARNYRAAANLLCERQALLVASLSVVPAPCDPVHDGNRIQCIGNIGKITKFAEERQAFLCKPLPIPEFAGKKHADIAKAQGRCGDSRRVVQLSIYYIGFAQVLNGIVTLISVVGNHTRHIQAECLLIACFSSWSAIVFMLSSTDKARW